MVCRPFLPQTTKNIYILQTFPLPETTRHIEMQDDHKLYFQPSTLVQVEA
uniref:Uncharacterized protein n=1 Tax=Anguilla anguilla TaxID=7936 RepID=A0A0E9V4S5_ANGAN